MKRTTTRIWIALTIVRDSNVAHLRMKHAMQNLPVHERAAADASSDRQIHEIRDGLSGSPARFCQGGCVDISIEPDRHVKRGADCADKIEVLPTQFRRGGDVAKCWR